MPVQSAGIILYRWRGGELQVLLAHPGGPYWARKDEGAWMIPKGEIQPGEKPLACAMREFEEELGARPAGLPEPLCTVRQAGGKLVEAFALEGDFEVDRVTSNSFEMEWPLRSGQLQSFPEVDAARWFSLASARAKILPSQLPLLDHLEQSLASRRI